LSLLCPDRPRGRLLLAAMAVAAGFATFAGYLDSTVSSPAPAAAARHDEQGPRRWTGTTAGALDLDVRPRVAGRVLQRAYAEGALVHRGDLLFQIDPGPFAARLAQARAALASARGQADAEALQAAVDQARLDLESTAVRSPITGVAADTQARPGDLVNPTFVLVTVSSIDPIRVRFQLAERDYLRFLDGLRPGASASQRFGDLELEPAASGAGRALRGRLVATDRQVDLASRTIGATGLFPNPGGRLRPGQHATLRELGQDAAAGR
jgi:membrane fusion protein, multidrug efflux system